MLGRMEPFVVWVIVRIILHSPYHVNNKQLSWNDLHGTAYLVSQEQLEHDHMRSFSRSTAKQLSSRCVWVGLNGFVRETQLQITRQDNMIYNMDTLKSFTCCGLQLLNHVFFAVPIEAWKLETWHSKLFRIYCEVILTSKMMYSIFLVSERTPQSP